jgi:O-antigen/teichoic acid export membrane protein
LYQFNYRTFIKDFGWYLAGTILPMLVGFIRSPIYTRIFTPGEYGYYSLVFITYSYLSIACYSWLVSSFWRFYINYKNNNQQIHLYTNTYTLFLACTLILASITLIWYCSLDTVLLKRLVLFSFFHYTTNDLIGLVLIRIRIEGKTLVYNTLQGLRVLIAFGLLLYLTFVLDFRIEAFVISSSIINAFFLLFIILFTSQPVKVQLSCISLKHQKNLLLYGGMSIIVNLSIIILATSDRYIIRIFDNIDSVGIYNQVYNISNISIAALVNVFLASLNPVLLNELENNFEGSAIMIKKFIGLYIYLLLPITVYLSLFSKQVSIILLGEKFRTGYDMIPWIMLSALLYGIIHFHEIKLKFSNSYRRIIIGFLTITLLNIVLNFIFIPLFGYKSAAITTFASYMILFLYFYITDSIRYLDLFTIKGYLKPALYILFAQVILDLVIRNIFNIKLNVKYTILEGIVFLLIYVLLTFRTNPLTENKLANIEK